MAGRIEHEVAFEELGTLYRVRLNVTEVLQVEGHTENVVDIVVEHGESYSKDYQNEMVLDLETAERLRDILDDMVRRGRAIPLWKEGDGG